MWTVRLFNNDKVEYTVNVDYLAPVLEKVFVNKDGNIMYSKMYRLVYMNKKDNLAAAEFDKPRFLQWLR